MKLRVAFLVTTFVVAGSAVDAESEPAHDYVLHCAGCHKLDGSGSMRVPGLHDVGNLVQRHGGREYVLAVPGVAQAPLSDARLADLLNWLVGHFGKQPPATLFSAAEVSAGRKTPLRDPERVRAALR